MFTQTINYLNSTDFKDLLEKASLASTIVLAFAAVCGLRQLTLFKKDIVLRNTRAAKERAIECAERYAKYAELDIIRIAEQTKVGVDSYNGPIGDFSKASLPSELMPDCMKRFSLRSNIAHMNLLEIIAATFVSGVADEDTGFQIFGTSFCASVQYNYDLISMWRKNATNTDWANVI